jgi:FkbM family methyltransferase
LGRLYKYDSAKTVKNWLRPLKHRLFGKSSIYKVMDEVAAMEGGASRVRVIFDVGAANGEYAVHFLKKFPDAVVYCFEPLKDSFEKLKQNTLPFGQRAKLFNFALYKENAELDFYVQPSRDGSSLYQARNAENVVKIQAKRLDDFVAEQKIGKIDFIKIDVEGAEKEVIDGGPRTFKENILNAFIEMQPAIKGYYSPDYALVFEHMRSFGFGFAGVFGDYFFSKLLPRQ